MKKNLAVIIVAANFLATGALAGTMGSFVSPSKWIRVTALSAGPVWE